MKIAILTQPLRANYGGVLQNFALQQVLIKLGHKPITIEKDYLQEINIPKLIYELPKRLFTKYILKKRKYILSERHNDYIEGFRRILKPFVKTYINHKYVKDFDLINKSKINAIVVGSDQVWRPIYNQGYIDKMYLSFIPTVSNIKRIAYAASFGTCDWEYDINLTEECSELIKRFDAVSTREIDGIELCHKYLGYKDAVSVLDPTLLLDKANYLEICKNIKPQEGKILFAYILDKDQESITYLENIAKQNGLKLKLVSAHEDCTLSMEEWLAMFRDAKCVITDSFHGTVFSIIFKKEFYTIANQMRGGSRFTSLLSQLSLTDRMFVSINHIVLKNDIDWTLVMTNLYNLRNRSINFIESSLI